MKRNLFIYIFFFFLHQINYAQETAVLISTKQFDKYDQIKLADLDGWLFRKGHDPGWANPNLDVKDWKKFKITQISREAEDSTGRIEGWFRIKIRLDESFINVPLAISRNLWAATDVYIDGALVHSFGNTDRVYSAYNPLLKYPVSVHLVPGKEYLMAIHFVDYETTFTQREIRLKPQNLTSFINLTGPKYMDWVKRDFKQTHIYVTLCLAVSFLLFFLYWFLVYLNPDQTIFRIIAWFTTTVIFGTIMIFGNTLFEITYSLEKIRFLLMISFQAIMTLFGLFILEWVLTKKISKMSWALLSILLIANIPAHIFSISPPFAIAFMVMIMHFGRKLHAHRSEITGANWAIIAAIVVLTFGIILQIVLHKYSLDFYNQYDKLLLSLQILAPPLFYLAYISVRFKETFTAMQAESKKLLQVTEEKRDILANQNTLLEKQVNERTHELNESLENLKATQAQLIQSEKMASLGELTAGIAHEIQNPLNFVNNFSEVSRELIDEMKEELQKGEIQESLAIAEDLSKNIEKINHHGQRASTIVKGMLEHSRGGIGKKEKTDINALCDEYLRLVYHGLRAKDKDFQAKFETRFEPGLPKVSIVSQDIGRVLLNIINNAFYAVREKARKEPDGYVPEVIVSARKQGDHIEISIRDNGGGIPDNIKDKIFQPFFTTKPTGEGTGLGLSLSYDIIKAHGGDLNVESRGNEGTAFTILLPLGRS